MSGSFWRSKPGDVQGLITWLLDKRREHEETTGNEGWAGSKNFEFVHTELAYAIQPAIPTGHVLKVLQVMLEENLSSPDDFGRVYNRLFVESPRDARRWTFYYPLTADVDMSTPSAYDVMLLDTQFRFISRSVAAQELGYNDLDQKTLLKLAPSVEKRESPPLFIEFSAKGEHHYQAFDNVAPAFDALRGFMEFLFSRGSGRIGGGMMPRARFPHPTWAIPVAADGEPARLDFDVIRHEPRFSNQYVLRAEHLEHLRKEAGILESIPRKGSTKSLIADCLRLFAQALEGQQRHSTFLGLWQVLESIALPEHDSRGDTGRVCRRIEWQGKEVGLPGSGIHNILLRFADLRNDSVHRGIHEASDYDINLIRYVAEWALSWLYREVESLPTRRHLSAFYRLREAGNTELDAIEQTAAFIRLQRSAT